MLEGPSPRVRLSPGKRRNKNNTEPFSFLQHTWCFILSFLSAHLPVSSSSSSSLSRRLSLGQCDFPSGPNRRTTASLAESEVFTPSFPEVTRRGLSLEPGTPDGSASAASAKKSRQTLRRGKYAQGSEKVPQNHFYLCN